MVPELKLAAAFADDSEKASITSPMNFKNEQDMIVHNVDTSLVLIRTTHPLSIYYDIAPIINDDI